MQTTNVSQSRRSAQVPFFPSQVGQSDNAPCPTVKPAPTGHLTAGRHEKEKPRTHAHTWEKTQASAKRTYKLYQKTENDFLQAIPIVFEQIENTKVIFHNNDYVDSIYNDYHLPFANTFLAWVKTFALMRSPYRESPIHGVIFSDDNDFLMAFRLLLFQGIKPQLKPKNHDKKVWDMIQRHFPIEEFQGVDLIAKMIIAGNTTTRLLNDFTDMGKLTKTKKQGFSSHFYQVVNP